MGKLDISLSPGGAHHWLNRLVGTWTGTTRTWFEPGKLADESPARGVIRPVFDGRFVVHEYEGTLCGEALRGVALYGCNLVTGQFESAWIDQLHMGTGIMFSEGKRSNGGFAVTGSYAVNDGSRWGWRTEIEIVDENQITIRAFNISPEGDEALGVETVYTREE